MSPKYVNSDRFSDDNLTFKHTSNSRESMNTRGRRIYLAKSTYRSNSQGRNSNKVKRGNSLDAKSKMKFFKPTQYSQNGRSSAGSSRRNLKQKKKDQA